MSYYRKIQIVGCGVIGLTTGITLQRRCRLPVEIVARDLPPHTTSNVAAAVWLPFQVEDSPATLRRAVRTRQIYQAQMADSASGVFETELTDLMPALHPDPGWVEGVDRYRAASPRELPAGFEKGVVATVPMIETPVYMKWLADRFLGQGAIRQAELETLDQLDDPEALVVNCSGLGARSLCGDTGLYPIRGQIARLNCAGYPRAWSVESGPQAIAYLLPRRNELVAGGTAIRGDWNEEVDEETARQILDKAARLDPQLASVPVIEHQVGLRPGRATVRLEREVLPDGRCRIHNYGHGGSGFTLAWACAEEVAALVTQLPGS